jgi:3-deoxy-D-manno-octulosonic-acid transferase
VALLYYLLQLLFYPLILPYLLYLSRRERYRESIPARFWLKNNPPFSHKSPYWFHACSLGEVNSIAPLLKRADRPNLSVITNTGRRRGEQLVGGERCRYLPIELFIPMWGYRPRRLISVEGELWYFLFWWVRRGGGKVVIVNGRIPDRSYPRYRRFRWF